VHLMNKWITTTINFPVLQPDNLTFKFYSLAVLQIKSELKTGWFVITAIK